MPTNPLVSIKLGRHDAGPKLTGGQLLAAAELLIGRPIRLAPGSSVDTIVVSDSELVVKYTHYDRVVMARETRVNGAYTTVRAWYLDLVTNEGDRPVWMTGDTHTAAHEDFQPYVIHESASAVRDVAEQVARREFEATCHRPGSGGNPMDNADRTAEGYTTSQMKKHWA
jgi:hypothetical protein